MNCAHINYSTLVYLVYLVYGENESVHLAFTGDGKFLVFAREKLVQKTRLERIQKWKTRMKASALSNCSNIFTYLRRKHSEFGHMTVTDSNGMPFYHQDDALALASDQWNQVFEANKEHIPSEPVLEVIHDALKKNLSNLVAFAHR